ncbi:hypothetical protein KIN20_025044 [Parelaphostrongylus tenuis]|uniref:Uncharacterized protein n=1 Tax=Parelaphostrongylus tenuis TaxID=148309 RepID=A0AAD5MUJ9_PARTN|nr:hypothetical protein KIN20_025044 [Parelaphostrongylus tenuis]
MILGLDPATRTIAYTQHASAADKLRGLTLEFVDYKRRNASQVCFDAITDHREGKLSFSASVSLEEKFFFLSPELAVEVKYTVRYVSVVVD